jgi:hypothetical protein
VAGENPSRQQAGHSAADHHGVAAVTGMTDRPRPATFRRTAHEGLLGI